MFYADFQPVFEDCIHYTLIRKKLECLFYFIGGLDNFLDHDGSINKSKQYFWKEMKKLMMNLNNVRFCNKCGAFIEGNINYCSKCGARKVELTNQNYGNHLQSAKPYKLIDIIMAIFNQCISVMVSVLCILALAIDESLYADGVLAFIGLFTVIARFEIFTLIYMKKNIRFGYVF